MGVRLVCTVFGWAWTGGEPTHIHDGGQSGGNGYGFAVDGRRSCEREEEIERSGYWVGEHHHGRWWIWFRELLRLSARLANKV
jgi:hypothetical protein